MITFGLLGYPLSHSFSRKFFNEKFIKENIDAQYLNFDLDSLDGFKEVITKYENLAGLNVTIPYKEAIIPYLDEMDNTAAEIKAVNVIKIEQKKDRKWLKGYNSDVIGFTKALSPFITNITSFKALVLGTGGASKAVVYALNKLGFQVQLVTRTKKDNMIVYSDLTKDIIHEHQVIVNTTPVGMFPHVDECPSLPYQFLTNKHVCFDLIYNPERTLFLKESQKYEATAVNGLQMLVEQAIESWRIWND